MQEIPTREEFLFLPDWQKALFYVLIFASMAVFAYQILIRFKLWRQGKPIDWKPDYIGGVIRYVLAQQKVKSSRPRSGAPMHLMIFYGFLALFIATTLLAINTYSPWKFHHGTYYLIYEFTFDWLGLLLVIGLIWALGRRLFFKPPSVTNDPGDIAAIALLLVVALTGYLVEAARMSANPKWFDTSAPIGHWLSGVIGPIAPNTYVWIWWLHSALVMAFIVMTPRLRLRHIAYAIFSAAGRNPDERMGALRPISMEEVEQTGKIGVTDHRDYSRWHLMSLDACMECGRCTDVCPAWNVGKSLNPKHVVQNIRTSMTDGRTVAEAVSEDALWACTTCNACVEACPVLIRHVDLIVDARRGLVTEGKLAGTAATMLRQVQSTHSAWGQPKDEREKWMEGHNIPLARDLISRGESFDVLLWVGCAGGTDPNAIRTYRSLAAMLHKAGVRFASLGREEVCTGDPARRAGDEFLFQEMAASNIATFEAYGVKTILTACPHCFNTIKNEYPQFEGHYDVLHHTQFLAKLVSEGKLKSPTFADGSVTIHDPCYLARINHESDAPRIALGVASDQNAYETPIGKYLNEPMEESNVLAEPIAHGRKTLCCGAGGARMWMEEEASQRPGERRAKQLLDTGAETIALGCPFCRIMLEASMQQVAPNHAPQFKDVAEILYEANRD